jgi:hypothetical protein
MTSGQEKRQGEVLRYLTRMCLNVVDSLPHKNNAFYIF